jgi:hypothetical protein
MRLRRSSARHGVARACSRIVTIPARAIGRLLRRPQSATEAGPQRDLWDFAWENELSTDQLPEDLLNLADVNSPTYVHGNDYQPSPPKLFAHLMQQLSICYEDYTFIDLGSGKGRALLLASHYPFKRIIGVEYSRSLHDAAEQNIALYRHSEMRCTNIEAIHADASAYELPVEPTVLYLYNPFDRELMARVADRILHSLEESPRSVILVYVNAAHHSLFGDRGFEESFREGSCVIFKSPAAVSTSSA